MSRALVVIGVTSSISPVIRRTGTLMTARLSGRNALPGPGASANTARVGTRCGAPQHPVGAYADSGSVVRSLRAAASAECEVKSCALARRALGPDPAVMTCNDPLHGGKADADAREFLGSV